jgi:hypothetical protein
MSAVVLEEAGREALADLFPLWRIWVDDHGWHARRRGGYLQNFHYGAPAFCVHAPGPVELAAQLRWQQAADEHAPSGCSARRMPGSR